MANITRFTPFDELFNDFTSGFFVRPLAAPADANLSMKLDVKENDGAYTIRADIPGVKKEDIQVDVKDDLVSIRAEIRHEKEEKQGDKVLRSERNYGMLSRSFSLPNGVDAKGAKAEYKDGVLDLVLPKKSGAASSRLTVQ
jgi:HSP20 family protein